MITALEIENFKGIAARQRIDFATADAAFRRQSLRQKGRLTTTGRKKGGSTFKVDIQATPPNRQQPDEKSLGCMVQFSLAFPELGIVATASRQSSWSHFVPPLGIIPGSSPMDVCIRKSRALATEMAD